MSAPADSPESFQITIDAAEAYEAMFVPAFFSQWAPPLCEAAGIAAGQRVLDVACGTGVVARHAAEIVGADHVVGVDLNEAMLTVARRVRGDIEWRQGDASSLPCDDATFDVTVCQMALMFFPDRGAAVAEMARATAPGGTVAVLVPSALDAQEAYGPFVEMAALHAGPEARSLLGAYFSCGDADALADLLATSGLSSARVSTQRGIARFPSVDAALETEVKSTPLGDRITDEVYDRISRGAHDVLGPFVAADGSLAAPFECLVAVGRRT